MNAAVNIPAIVIANLMGALLLVVAISSSGWHLRGSAAENRALWAMVACALLACIADPVCFMADGRPGPLAFAAVFGTNTFLFALDLIVPPCCLMFLACHLDVHISRTHKAVLAAVEGIGAALLAVNAVVPIVFSVDASNVYHRGPLYLLYIGMEVAVLLDCIALYLSVRRSSAQLRFFPLHYFMIPVFIGTIIQSLFYGVSTIWPFTSISVAGAIMGLQNELIFRDQLTGLFNRFYLDKVLGEALQRGRRRFTGIMADLNGFKSINDACGHAAGDEALRETAAVLRECVGSGGVAVRYAGDEFFAVLATQDPAEVEAFKGRLRRGLEELNARPGRRYSLSLATGHCDLEPGRGVDAMFDKIDALMYEDKRAYYRENPAADRRGQR